MIGAAGHLKDALTPAGWWQGGSLDPFVAGPLALLLAWYGLGLSALWRSAGAGRGVRRGEAVAFALGWLTLALALLSPLHGLSELLFSAHMAQHELLMAVAAPLLVVGRPVLAAVWALPPAWRPVAGSWASGPRVRAGWETVSHPVAAWSLHAAAIWLWHLPALYQASVEHESIHALQHISFLGSAVLFWWTILRRRAGRAGAPWAVVSLFTTAMHTGLLGALLAVSTRVWYPIYDSTIVPGGLTPLEDQQLAGLIMWIPAGMVYAAAALGVLASWLRRPGAAGRLAAATPLLVLAMLVAAGCQRSGALSAREANHLTGGEAGRGAVAVRQYGCGACHVVPGVPGAYGRVGPSLAGVGGQAYIGGVLTNTPDHLVRWIVNPRGVDSLTAMPNVGVSPEVARDIAAYLYTRP
ncbi:MAG TPA: cytochrome c oxidase assembly protein [Gemmatimonadales bacterium]|nr:cytochrome c oxidase assembly protein [Gemmatimonadales bacterium]